MRGQVETAEFCGAMLETLNNPRNAVKTHWSGMGYEQLKAKLFEEVLEVVAECEYIEQGGGNREALARELVDVANVCMMLREWCTEIKIGGTD